MRRGKTWKIWSHAVTSSRQRVDRCPTIINSVLCWTVLSAVNCEQYWHCHANPPASSHWTDNRNKSFKFFHQAPPSMCLPSVCLTKPHMTKSPRPSPSVFAYCKLSDLILEMGMAWKWGYRLHAPFCNNKIYSHCSHQQSHKSANAVCVHAWAWLSTKIVRTLQFLAHFLSVCTYTFITADITLEAALLEIEHAVLIRII